MGSGSPDPAGTGNGRAAARAPFALISGLTAVILWCAGALKLYSAAALPITGTEFRLDASLAALEIVFACWLVVGMYQRAARWLAALCFLAFLGVSLTRALGGEATCGCFGPLPINPWVTAGLDGFILVALLWGKPTAAAHATTNSSPRRLAVFVIAGGVSTVAAVVLVVLANPGRLGADGQIEGSAAAVMLKPEEWVGQPCPLTPQLGIGDQLCRGDWVVLLYRPDCPECQQMLPRYSERAAESRKRTDSPGWALVEIPKTGDASEPSTNAGRFVLTGELTKTRKWLVRTPVILLLREGVVRTVTHSLDEVEETR